MIARGTQPELELQVLLQVELGDVQPELVHLAALFFNELLVGMGPERLLRKSLCAATSTASADLP